tara:strand:- start:925 stop:1662 length:738 start_codon:yes stop_codon:yes gene_type:complete
MAVGDNYNNFSVWLELQRRNEEGGDRAINRLPLFVTEIQISTAKSVPTIPVPFASVATGKSLTLAFDMGLASKNVSLTGTLLNQRIFKNSGENNSSSLNAVLSPYEMAQLIHSYVDSSAAQDDQAINKLIILIPSRVDTNFSPHTNSSESDDLNDLPVIPFTFENRRYDEKFKRVANDYLPSAIEVNESPVGAFTDMNLVDDLLGMTGFIRSFNTTFSGEQPNTVPFTLEFEIATVLAENPINSL